MIQSNKQYVPHLVTFFKNLISCFSYDNCAAFSTQVPVVQYVCSYLQGTNWFTLCNWEKCIETSLLYLDNTKSPYFRAFGHYRVGVSYWMLGDKEKAADKLQHVRHPTPAVILVFSLHWFVLVLQAHLSNFCAHVGFV